MDFLHNSTLTAEELLPLLRERLAAGQRILHLPFRGFSMLPMLRQGKDTVNIAPLPEKLKKYDLPVYQYPSGKVVMHRVVEVREDHYICRGDNTYSDETIYPDQLIAVVTAFQRGKRQISTDRFCYRLYCRLWVAIYPIRKASRPIWRFPGRVIRYIRRHLR